MINSEGIIVMSSVYIWRISRAIMKHLVLLNTRVQKSWARSEQLVRLDVPSLFSMRESPRIIWFGSWHQWCSPKVGLFATVPISIMFKVSGMVGKVVTGMLEVIPHFVYGVHFQWEMSKRTILRTLMVSSLKGLTIAYIHLKTIEV